MRSGLLFGSIFVGSNDILDKLQAGSRRHHSRQSALIKLTDDVLMDIDKREVKPLLLYDFSEAFDTNFPSKLLSKLRQLGFSR